MKSANFSGTLRTGGNGGSGGNGGDGGGGEDPYGGPASIRMLIDAAKQMAEHVQTITLSHAEAQGKLTMETAEFLTDAIVKRREIDQEQWLELAKQMHETTIEAMQVTTRLARGVANRFEADEKRIAALEHEIRLLKSATASANPDAGSGP
jgi:polyhydroxyalkanoate synthesis regulator phasin